MKILKTITLVIIFASSGLLLHSCKNQSKTPEHLKETVDKSGYEYTAAYICPMHCKGSGSDQPGQCNICGMDYRENPESEKRNEEE